MNSTKRWILRRWIVVTCIVVVTFTLASYGAANLAFAKAKAANPTQPSVIGLMHVPRVNPDIQWNTSNHTLLVKITADSLVPNGIYSASIQQGFCTMSMHNRILFKLGILGADESGHAKLAKTIPNVLNIMPSSGAWSIDVYRSPQVLIGSQQERVYCANLSSQAGAYPMAPDASLGSNPVVSPTSSANDHLVHLFLEGGTNDHNQGAIGNAALSLKNNTLTVKISLGLLTPTSRYVAWIHKGNCQAPGPVVFPLNAFIAQQNGQGSSTTIINSVSIPSIPKMPWYIDVSEAPTNHSAASQAGINPFVCGDFSMAVIVPPLPGRAISLNSPPCCKKATIQ